MRRFNLTIEMDNAAFEDGPEGDELVRILRKLSDRLLTLPVNRGAEGVLHDVNGNKVGWWDVTGEPEGER